MDIPTAVVTFYADERPPRLPVVAIASGTSIFIYRNLRPYFKFTLPKLPVLKAEEDIWDNLYASSITAEQGYEQLQALRDEGKPLTNQSADFLGIDQPGALAGYLSLVQGVPLVRETVVTCLSTLLKSHDSAQAVGSLLVGTENSEVRG